MPRSRGREFTLADIMILVGFTAAGLAMARSDLPELKGSGWVAYTYGCGSPLLVCWTLALLILRLRKPRPAILLLFRQPGAAASMVALSSMSVWGVIIALNMLLGKQEGPWYILAHSGVSLGAAVLGAWLLLWVTRTGRTEPGWIDRSGIANGVGWIVLMLIVLYDVFLS